MVAGHRNVMSRNRPHAGPWVCQIGRSAHRPGCYRGCLRGSGRRRASSDRAGDPRWPGACTNWRPETTDVPSRRRFDVAPGGGGETDGSGAAPPVRAVVDLRRRVAAKKGRTAPRPATAESRRLIPVRRPSCTQRDDEDFGAVSTQAQRDVARGARASGCVPRDGNSCDGRTISGEMSIFLAPGVFFSSHGASAEREAPDSLLTPRRPPAPPCFIRSSGKWAATYIRVDRDHASPARSRPSPGRPAKANTMTAIAHATAAWPDG